MDDILQDQGSASAISADNQSDLQSPELGSESQAASEASSVDAYFDAPKSYKKEYAEQFKSLPPEMRKYLHEREKEVERGFSEYGNKLNGYKWLDGVYQPRQERLNKLGISQPKDWIDYLAKVDDALATDPQGTLRTLAEAYGVNLSGENNEDTNNPLLQKISKLEANFNSLSGFIANQRQSEAQSAVESFINAKDESGNPKHPHFDAVKTMMGQLLTSKVATSIEDAYQKAVWLVPDIQQKMLSSQAEASLKAKAEEAAKAKAAGFDPKGKAAGIKPEMTLEEELEQKFNAL